VSGWLYPGEVAVGLHHAHTDSSRQRNIGTAFGHSLLAIDKTSRGLAGLDAGPAAMAADLEANWEVLGDERFKELTRGRRITGDDLCEFVSTLGLPPEVEKRFLELTPQTYLGLAPELVDCS
jgi:adenylosuccinate lyase